MKLRKGCVMVYTKSDFAVMTKARAKREGRRTVDCSHCGLFPARWIDHLFPYHWEMNRCEVCKEAGL